MPAEEFSDFPSPKNKTQAPGDFFGGPVAKTL